MPVIKFNTLTQQQIKQWMTNASFGEAIYDGNNLLLFKNKYSCVWKMRTQYRIGDTTKYSYKTIGDVRDINLTQARKKADEIRSLIRQNINVRTYQKHQTNLGKTFGEIRDIYLQECKQRIKPQSRAKLIETLNKAAILNDTQIAKITERDINEIINKVKRTAPSTAANLLCEIKSIFAFAYEEKYLLHKLDINIKARYKIKERERYLDETKLGLFFSKLFDDDNVPMVMRVAIYTLFVTMLRREELLNLEWTNVDLNGQRITVRSGKLIDNFRISMPNQLLDKLTEIKTLNPDAKHVFSFKKHRYSGDTFYRYCKSLGIKYGIGEFTPHDARRTGMTLLADRGYSYKVIDMALGHVQKGVNKSYMKTHLSEPRAKLLQDWANLIDELMYNQ